MNLSTAARIGTSAAITILFLAACGNDDSDDDAASPATDIAAETASFDLAAGVDQRYLLGLFATEGGSIVDGTITLDFETVDAGAADDDRGRRGDLRARRRVRHPRTRRHSPHRRAR